jgi:hypothetical protein
VGTGTLPLPRPAGDAAGISTLRRRSASVDRSFPSKTNARNGGGGSSVGRALGWSPGYIGSIPIPRPNQNHAPPILILHRGTLRCPYFFVATFDATIRLAVARGFLEYKSDFYCRNCAQRMVESLARRGPGRPPKPKKFPDIAFQLPEGHYEYLQRLVRVNRLLGETENDAARYILIRELDKMMRGNYPKRGALPN